jgi:arabinofuranan 3-O-arabinosyltransferase
VLAAACLIFVVAKSDLAIDIIPVGNLSVGFTPIAVGALICFERDQWGRGTVLLVFSMLIKPLLLPLLALPVLRGHWRTLLLTGAPAVGVLIVSCFVVPGGTHFPSVIPRLLSGSTLVGRFAVSNISLSGLGDRLHTSWFDPVRILVAAAGIAALWRWRELPSPRLTPAAGVTALLVVFLAGSLSEAHYVLMCVPCVVLALIEARSRAATLVGGVGLAILLYPSYHVGGFEGAGSALQVRNVIGEAVLLVSSLLAVRQPGRVAQ